ncbi:MAG: hypothetical protein HFH82_12350 [Lachnospiraceae bacterium]|nr:hypothetical protein [Lachnospiraceae bacterium]
MRDIQYSILTEHTEMIIAFQAEFAWTINCKEDMSIIGMAEVTVPLGFMEKEVTNEGYGCSGT